MEILKRPILTEKATAQTDKLNVYAFEVNPLANKIQIKEAIEKMYSVTVNSINTMRFAGKYKSRGTKRGVVEGRTPNYKKAIVTLKQGDSIDFYSGI